MKEMSIALALIAGTALGAQANAAEFTFPSFNQVVSNTISSVQLIGAPAGTYNTFAVTADWSAIGGDPWSNEAIWAFTNIPSTGGTFYADPGTAPNAAGNGNSVTLSWSGSFDVAYAGGDPLHMLMLQTFGGSSANWNNISITIGMASVTVPTTLADLGPISGSETVKNQLAAGQVHWYSFEYDGVSPLSIDTLGSSLAADNDTEIGLYSDDGTLISTNDDIDFLGDNLLSSLSVAGGTIPAGTYYIAAAGFNTVFGANNFSVTSTSQFTGSLRVNINVPAPAGAGLLALSGIIASRRRRA